jgi:hypothetical protein
MATNPDTRSSRLESLTKMAQAALVEDINRMVARQAHEAAKLSAASALRNAPKG